MKKNVKWHSGVKNMVSMRSFDNCIKDVSHHGHLKAYKSDFILLSKRAGLGGWKNAVTAVVNRPYVDDAVESFSNGGFYRITKSELRKAATLL